MTHFANTEFKQRGMFHKELDQKYLNPFRWKSLKPKDVCKSRLSMCLMI
jgi:hypothetical protein